MLPVFRYFNRSKAVRYLTDEWIVFRGVEYDVDRIDQLVTLLVGLSKVLVLCLVNGFYGRGN